MDWYIYPLIIVAGFIAGFINTVAGSGSLITLPLLIFAGLPANIANGTNRIAILLQNVVAVTSFRREKILDLRSGLVLSIPAVVGAVIGAQIAVQIDENMMRRVIGALMLVMFVVLIFRPAHWLEGKTKEKLNNSGWVQRIILFGIGIYAGFVQAGVGIFLLAALVIGIGYDLFHANALKVFIVLAMTIPAFAVFILNNQVWWEPGLTLAFGQMLGAWYGARTIIRKGVAFIRWFLMVVLVVSAAFLLGLFEKLLSIF